MPIIQSPAPLGVAIVSFNTCDLLRDCLSSLELNALPVRVVVVDNASYDGSAAMVRAEFPTVELVALEYNPGFAAGNNFGLRQLGLLAGGATPAFTPPAFALLLNPDTLVHPGALEAMLGFLEAHPRVGMVSPRLLNPDGTLQDGAFRFPTLTMSLLEVFPPGEVLPGRLYRSWWHGRYPQERAGAAPFPIDHPLGACMLVRAEAVASTGPLDEGYFMYSEEIDWCWRMRRAGWAIWQVPAARITHIGGSATRKFRRKMLVELQRSRLRFFQLHYSPTFLAIHRVITRFGMLRASLADWRAYIGGRLDRESLRMRLMAWGEICRL